MANTTRNLIRRPVGREGYQMHLPVDGGAHIYEGSLVAQLTATGMLVPASTAGSGPAIGVACHEVDASAAADGDKRCMIETDRVFIFPNGLTTDAFSEASMIGADVFVGDDHTAFDNDGGATLQKAGIFMGMDPEGVRVLVSPKTAQY